MTDTGERSGGSWWPTVVLWGTVIAVGALYLMSLQRYLQDAQGGVAQAQHAVGTPTVPAKAVDAPVVGAKVAPEVVELVEVVEAVDVVEVAPLTPATATPISDRGVSSAQVATPAPEAQGAVSTSVPKEPSPQVAAPAATSAPEVEVVEQQVSPLEARAIAGAVMEAIPEGQTQVVAVPDAEPARALEQAQGAAARERARILAEYEALRRAAQADLERRPAAGGPWPPNVWSQGQVPWYSHPSYGPPGAGQYYAPDQPRW